MCARRTAPETPSRLEQRNMEAAVDRMEAQLGRWQEYIERRAAGLAATGRVPGFESLMRLDVLKALHAIAMAKCLEFRRAAAPERPRLRQELQEVWDELAETIRTTRSRN